MWNVATVSTIKHRYNIEHVSTLAPSMSQHGRFPPLSGATVLTPLAVLLTSIRLFPRWRPAQRRQLILSAKYTHVIRVGWRHRGLQHAETYVRSAKVCRPRPVAVMSDLVQHNQHRCSSVWPHCGCMTKLTTQSELTTDAGGGHYIVTWHLPADENAVTSQLPRDVVHWRHIQSLVTSPPTRASCERQREGCQKRENQAVYKTTRGALDRSACHVWGDDEKNNDDKCQAQFWQS